MRTILFTCLLLLCSAVSFSQVSVSGKVVDQDNQPVAGANVVVAGTTEGIAADFDGNFSLSVNKELPFSLTVSNIGYTTEPVRLTSNNQNLTVRLREQQTVLDEIVISASRSPERIRESPVTIERLDIKAIKNSASPSYYDALENLKGVDVNTSSLTFKSVNTRGFATFANNRFMQLVDGMDNSSPALNFPLGNLLGMSELDVSTVELLPGASSALYGANAFNGIMFMRSKNPFDHQGISFYVKTGMTSSENAGDNTFYDVGIRAAHAFTKFIAGKASFSFLKGTEWFATDYEDYGNPGATRLNPGYNGLNVYGDEVATTLNFDGIAIGLGLLPPGSQVMGAQRVSRTGYEESDLLDHTAESLKVDLALHLRPWADDFEIIWNTKLGRGNTIYQGANRYAIKDFFMQQHKLEIRNDNFFIRSYITAEKAGNSYDTRFGAINLNRSWKSDTAWFGDYAGAYIQNYLTILGMGGTPDPDAIHQQARAFADTGRLIPGTPQFRSAFNAVTSDGNLLTGAKFIDNTKLYHTDANYNFAHLTDVADIQIGGSYRQYVLNSRGTIFTDVDGPINYDEYGAYLQLQKKFAEDKVKFTGSVRYDKGQNFDGSFSPRISLVFSPDEQKKHNFRASYQTGFRNPTTQDQYIGLDVGNALLVGSAPDNLDRYVSRPIPNSTTAQALGFPETVQLTGRAGYENAYTLASVQAFGASAAAGMPDPGLLEIGNFNLVKPERVTAYEIGYRGLIADKFSVDLSAYYNQYEDFIANRIVVAPHYGNVNLSDINPIVMLPNALVAIGNGDYSAFQLYTNSNADINSYGGSVGVTTQIMGDFDLGISYTYAHLDFDPASDPGFRTNFNTPEHKVKASFGNPKLFENFGFNINWRWNDTYFWESSFADAQLPARSVVDLQINYAVPKIKSVFKAGAANLLGHEYISAPGSGTVGSQYFISWTINN
ncbi:MAG: carboxypeptidase-like regulatory domain-containing protein [Sinomicrobium sp.]|nr:carboxypeptidase-like regulatory domain-containing protein [Sinomicrobium sp.]